MSRLWLVLAFVVLTVLLALRFYTTYHNPSNYINGQFVSFETTLLSEPIIVSKYQKFSANLPSGENFFITTTRFPEFHYGDVVRIASKLNIKVLSNDKLVMAMYFPKIEAVKNDQKLINSLVKKPLAVLSFVRQKVIFLFEKTLVPVDSSLLLGIVFGIKQGMPEDAGDNFRKTGVLHVVAASGMNVAMVAGFLSSLFSVFFKRQVALIISIMGITFYAGLAGLEPSIVRASIMGALAFSAQILGRQRWSVYILFLTGYIMLLVSPRLLQDIGFQLSFLATLGILYIKPIFEQAGRLEKIRNKAIIAEDIATTIAAQIATLPILLVNFGTYSLWSIVVNGLVLWTIPFLMVIGGVGAIIGLIFEPLGQLFLYLSLPFLYYFEKVVVIFAGFGGEVSLDSFPWQLAIGYYGILGSIVIFFHKSKV